MPERFVVQVDADQFDWLARPTLPLAGVAGLIVQAAREAIHAHLDDRLSQRHKELIDRWKAEKVYPYSGVATSGAEAQERKVFDVVAVVKETKAALGDAIAGENGHG